MSDLIEEARRVQDAVYLATEKSVADHLARIIGGLADALARVKALHPDAGQSQGYTDTGYGYIEHACGTCGSFGEYGEPWPCDTYRAAEGQDGQGGEGRG